MAKLWAKNSLKIQIIPYMGIRFLAIIQPFFGQSGRNFCGNLGNYYLSIDGDKSMLCCSVSDYDFWALIGGEKGVATAPAPKGLGPQNLTKI